MASYDLLRKHASGGVVVVYPLLPAYWEESVSVGSPASHLAGLLRRRDPSTNPGPKAWCVSVGN